jgi:hypothetical protein
MKKIGPLFDVAVLARTGIGHAVRLCPQLSREGACHG